MRKAILLTLLCLFLQAGLSLAYTYVYDGESDTQGNWGGAISGYSLSGETVTLDEESDDGEGFTVTIGDDHDAYAVYGIYLENDSALSLSKDQVAIDVAGSGATYTVSGVDLYEGINDSLTIDGGDITITATGSSSDTVVYGLRVSDSNSVTITADSLSITAANDGPAYGIYMGTNELKALFSDEELTGCQVSISADTSVSVDGTPSESGAEIAPAIFVSSGDLSINTDGSAHTTVIEGDIIVGVMNPAEGYNFDASAAIDFTSADSTLLGNAHVSSSDSYSITLDLGFYDGATWVLGDSFGDTYSNYYFTEQVNRVTNLTLSGGVIDYTGTSDYRTIVVDNNLDGTGGTLLMKTDIAADKADQLDVAGSASGDHTVYVTNSGDTPTTTAMSTWLVRAASGDGTFTLGNAGGVVETGLYTYSLATRDGSEGGTEWYLRRNTEQKSQAGGMVLAFSGMASQYALTEALDSNLRQRLGDLRGGVASGLWARGFMQHDAMDGLGDVGFTQSVSGVELGADWRADLDTASFVLGLRLQLAHAWQDINDYSGDGETTSRGLALYGTWFTSEGWFLDLVASVDWFSQEMDTVMADGGAAGGDYDTYGFGLSAEFGRTIHFDNGFFLEPKARLRGYWIKGEDYTLSNGIEVDQDDVFFMTGRVGTLAGWKGEVGTAVLQAYGKGGLVLPLSGYQKATINGESFDEDYRSQTGVYYGIGFELEVNESFKLYGEGTLQNAFNGDSSSRGVSVAFSWLF